MSSLPDHLAKNQATGIREGQIIAQYEIGSAKNFVYLIIDWSARVAAMVDPHSGLGEVLADLSSHHIRLEKILLTHTHWDHIAGLPELKRQFPKISIGVHADDQDRLEGKYSLNLISDQEIIQVGAVEILALHTPGHSKGEVSYYVNARPPYLLSGDTIFIGDCGRTDLPTGSNPEMFASIQKVKTLPIETVLLPGHHYKSACASTLAHERKESPPFQCKSVSELEMLP